MTMANYNKIEMGKSVPRLEKLLIICEILQIEWNEIKWLYLHAISYTPQVSELASWSFWKGDIRLGKVAAEKMVEIGRETNQDHLIALGLFQIIYWDPISKYDDELRELTAEYMDRIGRKRTAAMIKSVMFDKHM